jgi:RNA polymerase sigma-70 factor (ECF subfamily)
LKAEEMPLIDNPQVVAPPEPFESFYRRQFRAVVALAYAMSGSRMGAEDLAQEAFMVAHRQWDRIGLYDRPEAWVRRVVSNMAVSAYRRHKAELKSLARLATQRQEVLPPMEPEDAGFWRKVRSLPPQQSKAITLYYLEDRSVAEIAEILDCSENTAKVHLFKGRQKLAKQLGAEAW